MNKGGCWGTPGIAINIKATLFIRRTNYIHVLYIRTMHIMLTYKLEKQQHVKGTVYGFSRKGECPRFAHGGRISIHTGDTAVESHGPATEIG